MIDIKFLRENPEIVKENIRKKFQDSKLSLVDEVIQLDKEAREVQQEADALRAGKNKIAKEIGALMAQGKKEEAEAKKAEVAANAKRLAELEVKENDNVIYRPSVMFIYSPCEYATKYFNNAKTDDEGENIIRGYEYPANFQIVYKEKIKSGTEYVGVLLLGDGFKPVWVGNRVETSFLYKDKKTSYWQTPTITPVAMSALAATCWMIKNKDKGGIYFPDDIKDYKYILKVAEKYISKTIYKTFSKEVVEDSLGIDINNVKIQDIIVK